MGLGILEPVSNQLQHVPGTVLLDVHNQATEVAHSTNLKKGVGRNSDIILVPQPSSSPNDPYNWPLWQRDMILLLYCYCTLLCLGGVGPIISPLAVPLIMEFKITFTQVSLLLGYNLAAVGAIGILVSAISTKFGKRPPLLASITVTFAGVIWCSRAQTYGSLLASRIIQGFGLAMFESVTYTLIGDLYHVHQRGTRMGFYILCQSGLGNLPGLVSGKISDSMGWRWAFYLVAIFMGIALIACFFFGWETVYNRNEIYNIDTSSQDNIAMIQELKGGASLQEAEHQLERTNTVSSHPGEQREPFLSRLRPFHGMFSDQPLWKMVVKPFFVLLNPIATWSILVVSFASLWVIAIALCVAQIFSAPPYNLTTAQIGYISGGPMVGGLFGAVLAGLVSDPIARFLTSRNCGIYEPEFRLPQMILVPIVSAIGYFVFGNIVASGQSPVAAAALWGVSFVAVQVAAVATGNYIIDAFRDVSIEIFIISMTVKNFLWFGFSFFLNDWLASAGPTQMFSIIGGVQVGLSLTTVPVYIYGKRLRAWWHIHNYLDRAQTPTGPN